MEEKKRLLEKIEGEFGIRVNPSRFKIVADTSDWMRIYRGDVIRLNELGKDYAVLGNMRETRFGISDQPKYWVFAVRDMDTGEKKIIKTVYHEEFHAHIGIFKIRCYRDPIKESDVIRFFRGDSRFMQGVSAEDDAGNNVRVLDFIKGPHFFELIPRIKKSREDYFREDLPVILWNLKDSMEAILDLHRNGFCHGDIRNDHLIVDAETKRIRWIDFDLKQDVTDFDLWSVGNILAYAVAKGILTFKQILRSPEFSDKVKLSLRPEDGSAFYNYRLMNLKKAFPYIPPILGDILQRFCAKPKSYFQSMEEFFDMYTESLEKEFPEGKNAKLAI